MVLVDTSIWIDFFSGRETPEVTALVGLLENEETIAFTGAILQELLQGCSGDRDASTLERHFQPFIELFAQRSSYKLAAKIFRDCRRAGHTIRSSVDCLIAACALEQDCVVFHKDRDFDFMKTDCGLKVFRL